MSGGGGSQTQQQGLPAWLTPYVTSNLGAAQGLENTGQFSGSSQPVAPLSSLQQQGIASTGAVNPTSINSANGALTNILQGNNLSPSTNPSLQQTFQTAANQSQNQIASEFAGNGRNVTASMPVQADANAQLANQIYGGNYANAQNQITAAAGLAPQVTSGLYTPSQNLLSAGQTQQTEQQNQLNAPYNTLSWYSSLLNGQASPFRSTTSSNDPGVMANISSGFSDIGQLI